MRKVISDIQAKKQSRQRITMLTAYDYPLAVIIDRCDIDIILVGDSLANVVFGMDSTTEVSMDQMIDHTKAVNRAVNNALLVGDMPFEAYQKDTECALKNAQRFIDEAGCSAIKLEWFDKCLEVTQKIVAFGIPVMGHIGLTPQTAEQLGGFKVQGKDADSAKRIIQQAQDLEAAGCFSIVLECIPDKIAELITNNLNIPTIGIGGGPYCDGQVLVTHDILGLFDRFRPKFVKQYVDCATLIEAAVKEYKADVESNNFPQKEQSFGIKSEEFQRLKDFLEP